MPAHSSSPSSTDLEDQETNDKPTWEDKAAQQISEENTSKVNLVGAQILLAFAGHGVFYGGDVKNAYKLLKNPLDPDKLITDPSYKKQVERAAQLVARHEGRRLKKGLSKYSDTITRVKEALKTAEATQVQLNTAKAGFITSEKEGSYFHTVGQIYDLDEKQLAAVKQGAWRMVQENPSLSINDALRIQAEKISLGKVKKDVRDEAKESGKRLSRKKEEELIKKKLEDIRVKYENTTQGRRISERNQIDNIISKKTETIKGILSPQAQPQPVQTLSPQPISAPSSVQPSSVIPPPTVKPAPASKPSLKLSTVTPIQLSNLSSFLKNINISPITTGLKSFFALPKISTGLGKLSSFLPGVSNTGSSLLSQGANLLKSALPKALNLLKGLSPHVLAVSLGAKFAKPALIIVVTFLVLIIFYPIIFGNKTTSHVTPQAAIQAARKNQTYSWQVFENKYLVINPEENSFDNNFSNNQWHQFENKNLSLGK
ncbi:hypothetical protein A2Y99_04125 [Candidatus Gottesmanbacteria bacterium RBG_13_37_7]|uniref:Uncharacterized protein n=1 Tax=Candidatus Gottesmanbacteria bacterium RBG_13_37_7 TaxID=1798369 RepID=A0A1F5YGK3_9BACT|nr:MAG: hypothetical protein A2Y99_04125 [Candidatus Gottesmanbacteria bacterium RBG_13_37_7]